MKELAKHQKVMTLFIGLAISFVIGIAIWLLEQHELSATTGANGTSAHSTYGVKGANGANGTSTHGINGNNTNGAGGINGDSAAKSGVFFN